MSAGKLWFTPTKGMKIPDPELLRGSHGQTVHVPEGGKWVIDNHYWRRRVSEGAGTLADTVPAQVEASSGRAGLQS